MASAWNSCTVSLSWAVGFGLRRESKEDKMLETVLAGGVWMGVVMGFGLVGLGVSLWALVGGRRSRRVLPI